MKKVYNWQLKRSMDYPYEGKYPEKQFAAVFNINRFVLQWEGDFTWRVSGCEELVGGYSQGNVGAAMLV